VLVVLLAFFACDPNPPSNGSDVKDQSVKDVQPVSNDLKKSGATNFLDLDDEDDLGMFFESFTNDTALMNLFESVFSEDFDPTELESDEIVQDIMGFIGKLSNIPEGTSSINESLNIKNKKFLDLIYINTLISSVKGNINTKDGKAPEENYSNVKSVSMSASLESDVELITDTFKDAFIKDLKLRVNASGSLAANDFKKIENNLGPGDEFDFEFGDEFDTSPESYDPTSYTFSYALDLSAGASVCDDSGKGGILVLKINMNKPVTTIKLEDFEGLDDPSEMIEKILPSTFVLNLSVLDDSGTVKSEKNITMEDIMEMISNINNNGYGGYDYN
jgi:hypothetical protein